MRAFASPRARGRRASSATPCTAAAKQDEALLVWCKGHGLYISPKLALGVDPEVNVYFNSIQCYIYDYMTVSVCVCVCVCTGADPEVSASFNSVRVYPRKSAIAL